MPRALRPAAAAVALCGLALLLASTACGPREPLPAPEAYDRFCARCHGDDGRGDPKTVALNPRLDLVASEMVRAGNRELVRDRIAKGKGAMPALERKLVPGELEALTEYTLERFGGRGAPPPPRPAPDPNGGPAASGSGGTAHEAPEPGSD